MSTLARWSRWLAVVAIALCHLALPAAPAAAANTPWRFTSVTADFSIAPSTIGSGVATCPEGFIPVGGGISYVERPDDYERVAEYREGARQYKVLIHNYSSTNLAVQLTVTCAWQDHVGDLQLVSADYIRHGTMAGGNVLCPAGKVAIAGGADWNTTGVNTRRIDLFAPTADGRGWYASGESPVDATLHIEAYCASAEVVGVSPVSATYESGSYGRNVVTKTCDEGRRAAGGGVILSPAGSGTPDPWTWRGNSMVSFPTSASTWHSDTLVAAGTRITLVVWCIPIATPIISVGQFPPQWSDSSEATISFSVLGDLAEPVSTACVLVSPSGSQGVACSSGQPVLLTGLGEGAHEYQITATTASGQVGRGTVRWTVDLTEPTATGPLASPQVSGPVSVSFSEPVKGVSASSITVRVAGQATTLPGTVTRRYRGATWTPQVPLVPGERYTLSLSSAIEDLAGNALVPVEFTVRASTIVQNTSVSMVERWDRDTSASAYGGAIVESATGGSTITWTFTAAAGQRAKVRGVRTPSSGFAEIRLDGVKTATVSFYAASTTWKAVIHTSAPLTAGQHTLEVRVLGSKPAASSGSWVGVDALQIGLAQQEESAATQVFRRATNASASGGSFDNVAHRTGGDTGAAPSYVLTFAGTGVRVFVTKTPASGSARFLIDGVVKQTVALGNPTTAYAQLAFTAGGLAAGRHTLEIRPVGTATGLNSSVAFDYAAVS